MGICMSITGLKYWKVPRYWVRDIRSKQCRKTISVCQTKQLQKTWWWSRKWMETYCVCMSMLKKTRQTVSTIPVMPNMRISWESIFFGRLPLGLGKGKLGMLILKVIRSLCVRSATIRLLSCGRQVTIRTVSNCTTYQIRMILWQGFTGLWVP